MVHSIKTFKPCFYSLYKLEGSALLEETALLERKLFETTFFVALPRTIFFTFVTYFWSILINENWYPTFARISSCKQCRIWTRNLVVVKPKLLTKLPTTQKVSSCRMQMRWDVPWKIVKKKNSLKKEFIYTIW